MDRMGRYLPVMVLVGAALLVFGWNGASVAASGSPVRAWGGTHIRSLDAPAASGSADASAPALPRFQDRTLSNERTTTRWANAAYRGNIFSLPDTHSRHVGRLRWDTEDGFPEVYLLLRSHLDVQGREWVKLRVPGRPNGLIGWVRRQALDSFHVTHKRIVIDRRRLTMTVYANGHRRWSAPVGIGKRSTPTPAGNFWIRERFKVTDRRSPYAPYALGTSAYSSLSEWPGGGVVGIHGDWNQPRLIPGRPSHGCIRLHRPDATWLAHHAGPGTPLLIKR